MSHPPSGYGIWLYCDCISPTVSLRLLLCLWMWGIIFGEFQCLPIDDCSAVSCDSDALARGSGRTSFWSAIWSQSPLHIPGAARCWKRQGKIVLQDPLAGENPCWHLDFGFLASRTAPTVSCSTAEKTSIQGTWIFYNGKKVCLPLPWKEIFSSCLLVSLDDWLVDIVNCTMLVLNIFVFL